MIKNPLNKNIENCVRWISVKLPNYFKNGKIDQVEAQKGLIYAFRNQNIGKVYWEWRDYWFLDRFEKSIKWLIEFYSKNFEEIYNSNLPEDVKFRKWKAFTLDRGNLIKIENIILNYMESDLRLSYDRVNILDGTHVPIGHEYKRTPRTPFRETFARARTPWREIHARARKNPYTFNYSNLRKWLLINIPILHSQNINVTLDNIYYHFGLAVGDTSPKAFSYKDIKFRYIHIPYEVNSKNFWIRGIRPIIDIYLDYYKNLVKNSNKLSIKSSWNDFFPSLEEIFSKSFSDTNSNYSEGIILWLGIDPDYFGITYSGPIRFQDFEKIWNNLRSMKTESLKKLKTNPSRISKQSTKKRKKINPGNPLYREITKEHHTVKPWWDTKRDIKEKFIHEGWYLFVHNDRYYEIFQFIMYGSLTPQYELSTKGNEPIFSKYHFYTQKRIFMTLTNMTHYWKKYYFLGPFQTKDEAHKYAESNGYELW